MQETRQSGFGFTSLFTGILEDAKTLMRQEAQLLKNEIKLEVSKAGRAASGFGIGAVLAGIGALFLLLMLVHGLMDDNVPPYNTTLVVNALIKAGKDFDLLLIPYAHHGYGVDNNYAMRRRWDYFVKNLMGAEPPNEYQIGNSRVTP